MNNKLFDFSSSQDPENAILGSKGVGLVSMYQLGMKIPPGFIITTDACESFYENNQQLPPALWRTVKESVQRLGIEVGNEFGSPTSPLILSVRSGAAVSMPGMMDTILNVGLNSITVEGLAKLSDRPVFAYECYRRLIHEFASSIYKASNNLFQEILTKHEWNPLILEAKNDIGINRFQALISDYLEAYKLETGDEFPQDPYKQLKQSIITVFNSWFGQRAIDYRKYHGIKEDLGTAVIVQKMVFGNMGADSGTGVIFSRSPATGESGLFGEYLLNAQGEDLVAGIRTPKEISGLAGELPNIYEDLIHISQRLERHYRDIQDIEFTIEEGKLWILQTRAAKRTPSAAVKYVVDMVEEGILNKSEAIQRIDPQLITQMFSQRFSESDIGNSLGQGIASSPGAATGRIAFDKTQVIKLVDLGEPVIFVRENTSPDDVSVMPLVEGVLTKHGGATSHAAVVARGLGKPCVVGCEELNIDLESDLLEFSELTIASGEYISIDGTTGFIFEGKKEIIKADVNKSAEIAAIKKWLGDLVPIKVYANANTPSEVENACEMGAEAIFSKTEWMYNDFKFRSYVREVLLGESEHASHKSIEQLKQLQVQEFKSIFDSANDAPVYIRLLSEPLDVFLPVRDNFVTELAELRLSEEWSQKIGNKEQILQQINSLEQVNPRFGRRGSRLMFAMPDLAFMQVRAIVEAACDVARKKKKPKPELRLLLPWVIASGEVADIVDEIHRVATSILHDRNISIPYEVGALIETPRAAMIAGEIASVVDFICFGTDGLTETSFGYSREDGDKFIPTYIQRNILEGNPLETFDEVSVGEFIKMAVTKARVINPDISIGICGGHVTSSNAINFFHKLGLDFICADIAYLLDIKLRFSQAGHVQS